MKTRTLAAVLVFVVNHEGVVYEKDLGGADQAAKIKRFDPDKTWSKVP